MKTQIKFWTVLGLLTFALFGVKPNVARAEGTKEMVPTSGSNNVQLQVNRSNQGGFASTFAGWTATSVNDRLYIHINDYTTEKIYLGFKEATSGSVYYRIKRPDGTVVVGPTQIPSSGTGAITSWSQANIGPNNLTGNNNGYTATVINLNGAAATRYNGDFYIEFNTSNSSANTDEIFLDYYDITVANGTANTSIKKGRLWSYYWGFNSNGYTPPNTCVGSLYVYSKDSVVTEVDLNGISPYYFRIFANSTGVGNTGNIIQDRKSKNFGSGNPNERPEYKIFLNDPDLSAYPSANYANRTASFNSLTGCPGNYCFNFTVNGEALAELKLDLNNNGSYTDAIDRVLEANVVSGLNCIAWDGKDGLGNNVANNTNVKLEFATKVGTLHIPVYDAEQHTSGYRASIIRPAGIGTMTVYWDDASLSGGSTNLTGVAANAPLTGGTTGAGHHSWNDPSGNQRTMNTWFTTKKVAVNTFSIPIVPNGSPVVADITGANFFCIGSTLNLGNVTPGGTWSSSNTAIATVNSSGVVSGVSSGGVTISYAVTNGCGTTTVTKGLTVNALPTVKPIYGVNSIGTNQTTTFTDSTALGVWATVNPAIATVNSVGLVTGVSAGTTDITYTVSNNCGDVMVSKPITITNISPTAVNDTAAAQYNVPVNINALTNDLIGSFPFNPSSLVFLPGTAPDPSTVGTFTNNANGTVTFTSVSTFSGYTSIGYKIYDQGGLFSTAYIVVNVSGPCSVDGDNDNVPDCLDEYPTDANRAFNNYFPPVGHATLMFEDEWPNRGDYDLNDVVVDYRSNTITNGDNNVVEMKYSMVLRCSGAGLHNGFAFQLDNVPTNKITSVTGTKTHGASWLNNANNGVESGQDYANVVVFDDVYKVLIYPGSGSFLNTYMSAPKVAYDTSNITITFINNGVAPSGGTISLSNLPQSSFNPYVIIGDSGSFDQIRSKEVHLPNRIPSKKMNNAWFGVNDDSSNPAEGRYYKTVNNLPWGLNISTSVPYMQEKVDISLGYKKFIEWATSNGNSFSNWYQAIEGFRDQSKLYTK
jgi:LruC domain-containing protein